MTDRPSDGHDFIGNCGKNFKYLQVTRILQHVPPQALDELRQRLGFQGGASSFSLTGQQRTTIVELCLLHSPPFRATEPHQLHDTRRPPPHGRRFHTCIDRGRLIGRLADDLLEYEFECHAHDMAWRQNHRHAQTGLQCLQHALQILSILRDRGLSPTNPSLRRLRTERLQSALDVLTRLVEGLTPDDYRRVDHPRPVLAWQDYIIILSSMEDHMHRFGPQKFSSEGIYHVLAEILIAFGLEGGIAPKVARRLQKRLSQFHQ